MQHLFLDIVRAEKRMFDFQGMTFQNHEAAYQQAQILALDSGSSQEWHGGCVEVRDAAGARLFVIPIGQSPELTPAG